MSVLVEPALSVMCALCDDTECEECGTIPGLLAGDHHRQDCSRSAPYDAFQHRCVRCLTSIGDDFEDFED